MRFLSSRTFAAITLLVMFLFVVTPTVAVLFLGIDPLAAYQISFSIFLVTISAINLFAYSKLRELYRHAGQTISALRERSVVAFVLFASTSMYAFTGLNGVLHFLPPGSGIIPLTIGIAVEAIPSLYWLRLYYTGGFHDSNRNNLS